MFVALMQLKTQCPSLNVNITFEGDGLTVLVLPKGKGGDAALLTPLRLSGTAEELEAGFFEAIAKFGNVRQSVAEQVEATTAVLEAARKESANKAANAIKKSAKTGSSPKVDPTDDDDDLDQQNEGGAGSETPADSAQSAANIFSI